MSIVEDAFRRDDDLREDHHSALDVDKGLLAIVLAGFAWWLNRSLERLKSSLSWRNELLKECVSQAKTVLTCLNSLEAAHDQMSARIKERLPLDRFATEDWESFMTAKRQLIDAHKNARLFLSPVTIRLIEDANDRAMSVAKLFVEHVQSRAINEDELSALELALERAIAEAATGLQMEFDGTAHAS